MASDAEWETERHHPVAERLECPGQVERMARLPRLREPEVGQRPPLTAQDLQCTPGSPHLGVSSPRRNDERRAPRGEREMMIVLGANRVSNVPQLAWIGRAKREQIHDLETPIAPVTREADAAPDRWVIAPFVRCRRVQHAEHDDGTRAIPAPPQPIAIATIARKGRARGHCTPPRVMDRGSSTLRSFSSGRTFSSSAMSRSERLWARAFFTRSAAFA